MNSGPSAKNAMKRADMKGSLVLIVLLIIALLPAGLFSQEEEEEEENPHKEMLEDEFVCLDCHTEIPKKGETSPDYFLVDLPSENCLGCHEEIEHAGVKEHEGEEAKPLPGDENGKIACFSCHDPHPQGAVEGRTVYKAKVNERTREFIRLVVLPNLEENVDKELHAATEEEVYLRLPIENNELCSKCHESFIKTDTGRYMLWDRFLFGWERWLRHLSY